MSDWSDEVENEEAEREKQHQKKERRQQRQSSIERYRPGAKQREDLRRPNNEQQPGLESNDLRHLLAEKRSQQGKII